MSRETVRLAAYNYLTAQHFQGIQVYEAMPKETVPPDSITLTTAALFPITGVQEEKRIGMGAKQITYTVTLQLAAFSNQERGEDAQSDFDAMAERVMAAIRADPTLGTASKPDPVFQAGEGDGVGTPDLKLQQDVPVLALAEAGVHIWGHLDVTALEIINA